MFYNLKKKEIPYLSPCPAKGASWNVCTSVQSDLSLRLALFGFKVSSGGELRLRLDGAEAN